ncbi:MAG: hypothetical protein WDW38_000798 [Sanguina aurantia]
MANGDVLEVPSYAHTLQGAPVEQPLVEGTEAFELCCPPTQVDKKDADTPDNWIRRDARIQRLTGRHPLNCEPPMEDLMAAGFITPPAIHYVRNHGAVPKISWGDHAITISGLVGKPVTLTMDEIVALPSVTIPITLVCAGNRRKEENMLKKSIGFNWGPCSTSCSYWTGVRLRDLLIYAGVKTPEEGAAFVCFGGPKGELPKGKDGSYGTSLTLAKAMDASSDVLIAYKQNHRWLTPDHGFPVRIVIPGFIGGRMVKWLTEITVTAQESDNFYHYHDNRVMPSHVDETLAKEEGWWFKPDFIINDLNINSAVARPWHDEVVSLKENSPYTVKGYAYAGGGRKIIRVEISLDDGVTWQSTEIRRFEKPNAYGKYWCWVHWDIVLPSFSFLRAKELVLRAWDDSMNTQPDKMTWNLMGMMNNCLYRIKIHPHMDETSGALGLRFQHPAPVEPGVLGNVGWKEEEHLARQAMEVAPPPVVKAVVAADGTVVANRKITMEEVAQHTTEESAWFVWDGKVYDATPFLDEHPGGAESILISTGMDATDEFNAIHSSKAKKILAEYYIGDLAESVAVAAVADKDVIMQAVMAAKEAIASDEAPVALQPRDRIKLPLIEKIEVSHNTRIFRFGLPTPQHRLGLPIGKHVFTYASINGENVMRAYTPTSCDDDLGRLDLLMKVCITPCYQVIKAVLKDAADPTQLSLLYANQTEADILLREELEELANNHPDRFRIYHTLSLPPAHGWEQGRGRMSEAMLRRHLWPAQSTPPAPGSPMSVGWSGLLQGAGSSSSGSLSLSAAGDRVGSARMLQSHSLEEFTMEMAAGDPAPLALMCGPKGMIEHVCIPALTIMGYAESMMVEF